MALDTNLPMQGQQLDTASPLMNLVEMTRQSRLDNAQLAGSAIDLQNKKNMLAMQTLTAAAAGGQKSYDTAKANLTQSGIDVSGWAPDYQTGQKQAQALQTALIPPVSMMNAGIAQQKANDEAAATNGTIAPVNGGAAFLAPKAVSPPVAQQGQGAQVQQPASLQQAQSSTLPNQQTMTTAMNSVPDSAIPAQNAAPSAAPPDLQQHYQSASPEDQKTAQNIVSGAAQLQGMQGDPQAVQKFLDDPNNMHDQHNIDMRKLWMSDNSPDKQQFWQANATDLKAGQAMGIAPASQGDITALPKFNPPAQDPNLNIAANNAKYSQALEAHKAEVERIQGSPQYKAAVAQATTSGTSEATNVEADKKSLNILQANLPTLMERLQSMRDDSAKASYGIGVSKEGDGIKQAIHNQLADETATANANLAQKSAQSVLPELGPALQAAGVRGNKFLENIANNAVGLDLAAPPAAKLKVIDGLSENYVNQMKAASARLREQGQAAPTDQEIDAQVAKIKSSIPSNNSSGGGEPNISPSSVKLLKGQPTPKNRAFFDARYGAGASAKVLGGQ